MKPAVLFKHENVLPTAPRVIQELIDSFANESMSSDELARKIAVDPVLSANVLRLANSPYYLVSRQIGSVEAAVTMLGFVTVRTLVITCSLVTRFKTTQGIDLKQFWRYCLSTAVAAKWLATETGEDPELAFTIGIIHALGELMLHLGLPEQVMTLDKITSVYSENRLQMERDVFGFSYADATAELIARWQFPDVIVSAIRAFSRPIDADSLNRQGAILYLAALLARHAELKVPKNAQRSAGAAQVAELLGLKPNVIFDAMPSVDELRAGLENLMP